MAGFSWGHHLVSPSFVFRRRVRQRKPLRHGETSMAQGIPSDFHQPLIDAGAPLIIAELRFSFVSSKSLSKFVNDLVTQPLDLY